MARIITPAIMVMGPAFTVITVGRSTAIRFMVTLFTAIRSTATGSMTLACMGFTVADSMGEGTAAAVLGPVASVAAGFTAVAEVIVKAQGRPTAFDLARSKLSKVECWLQGLIS